jgi:PAS domain S-box-containing protein
MALMLFKNIRPFLGFNFLSGILSMLVFSNVCAMADTLVASTASSKGNERLKTLYQISHKLIDRNVNESIIYADSLLNEARLLKNDEYIISALDILGEAYYNQDDSVKAVEYYEKAVVTARKTGNKIFISNEYNSLGIAYSRFDARKALQYYRKALEIKEELKDTAGISAGLNNLGTIYDEKLGEYEKAYGYYLQSYKLDLKRKDFLGIATSLLNIGDIKRKQKLYQEAIDSCLKSVDICTAHGFGYILELNYESLYQSYEAIHDFNKTYLYYKKFSQSKLARFDENLRQHVKELETRYKSAEQLKTIALVQKQKSLQRIIIYFLILAFLIIAYFMWLLKRKSNNINIVNDALSARNEEIEAQKEALKDQTSELEKANKELIKLSVAAEKTDNSIIVANAEGEIIWVNNGFRRMLGVDFEEFSSRYTSNFYTASLHPDIRGAVDEAVRTKQSITYSSYTVTRAGREIWIHTTLTPVLDSSGKLEMLIAIDADVTRIKEAERELAIKQVELTDSITYAKHIQIAMLPPEQLFEEAFKDSFILYRPKDIVSGDFYWLQKKNDVTFLAIADCTGHGIPGAFMSILCISLLNEIVNGIYDYTHTPNASEILNTLRESVKTALRQKREDNIMFDGMDIGLCVIDKNKKIMEYAGAYHHLFQLTQSGTAVELREYEGDKMPIGVYPNDHLPFTNHKIPIEKGDSFYLFTDGYIHQWGGADGKKFSRKKFRELLIGIAWESMFGKRIRLEQNLEDWMQKYVEMGNRDFQVDDILVVGFSLI